MKEIHVGADEEELSSIIRGLQHQISVLRQQCDEDIQVSEGYRRRAETAEANLALAIQQGNKAVHERDEALAQVKELEPTKPRGSIRASTLSPRCRRRSVPL